MVKFTSFGFRIVALLLSFLYLAALPLSCLMGFSLKGPTLQDSITITAHAGCMGQPENTVTDMEAGVAAGA